MTAPAPHLAAPLWRREPYRLLFPLGVLLLWAGVAHWVLFSLGWLPRYEPVFHSIAQVQGFLTAFAAGFLLTAIPRRTGTAAPGAPTMLVMIVAPVATTVLAWNHALSASQAAWFVLVATLTVFALRRFRHGSRRPPASFVWVPIAFVLGIAGSGLIALYGILSVTRPIDFAWHDLGRGLLLQGMFLGLVVGVGGLALPLMTRKESAPDLDASGKGTVLLHLLGAAVLVLSFVLENFVSLRLGFALRAVVVAGMLVLSARVHRPPTVPGLHRRYMWLSVWLIPLGYALAAVFPGHLQAGLHTVFVGGFTWLTLAIGMHVTLAHGGAGERLDRPAPAVVGLGACVVLALAARVAMELDPGHRVAWIGTSAAFLLLASVFWLVRVIPFAAR